MTDKSEIILEPVSVCPRPEAEEQSAGDFFVGKGVTDMPIVGTPHNQQQDIEEGTISHVGEETTPDKCREASMTEGETEPVMPEEKTTTTEREEEAESEYYFGILGTVKPRESRSDRIRETRLRSELARDNERIEMLRRANEENARREREDAERMQKGIGELFSSIPRRENATEEPRIKAPTDTSDEYLAWDIEWTPEESKIVGQDGTVVTEAEKEQESYPSNTEGAEPLQNNQQTTTPVGDGGDLEKSEETLDYTITVEETSGRDYLHIDGVTVAHIDLSSDGGICVREPSSTDNGEEKVTRIDTSVAGNGDGEQNRPICEPVILAGGTSEQLPTDYDISSPYPDPAPRSESTVRFDLGGSLEEELDRLPKDKGHIKESDMFERERELREQIARTLTEAAPRHSESPTEHQIDTSPTYPDVHTERTPTVAQTQERETSQEDQRHEEMMRVLRDAENDERRRRTQSSVIDPVVDMERAREVDSESRDKPKPEPPKPQYSFNRGEARRIKSKQSATDVECVEERVRREILSLREKNAMFEYSFSRQLEDGAAKKERLRVAAALKKAEQRFTPARNFEMQDNERYYRLTLVDIAHDRLPRKADKTILASLQSELCELLHRRDELNMRLIELYRGSAGGKKNFATKRLDAYISGMRAEYQRLRARERLISSYSIGLENKRHLFTLMDRRVVLSGELEKVKHIIGREWPKGDYLKALQKERKRLEGELRANRKELDDLQKKVLSKAEKSRLSRIAMAFGWGIFILLVVGGVAAYIFRDTIISWFEGML